MQASYRHKRKFMPEVVCNFGFDMRAIYTVPVDQVCFDISVQVRNANTTKL